jgi:hypothetical protein
MGSSRGIRLDYRSLPAEFFVGFLLFQVQEAGSEAPGAQLTRNKAACGSGLAVYSPGIAGSIPFAPISYAEGSPRMVEGSGAVTFGRQRGSMGANIFCQQANLELNSHLSQQVPFRLAGIAHHLRRFRALAGRASTGISEN